MNKLISIFCLSLLTQTLYAQQFLWTTAESTEFEYLPIENVTSEVLNYYDFYKYYSDGSGERYNENSENWESLKKSIIEIEELTVFALKDNLGKGSVILVVLISSKGVDMVAFTNNFELDAIDTSPYDKDKFEKWFNSLLNWFDRTDINHKISTFNGLDLSLTENKKKGGQSFINI